MSSTKTPRQNPPPPPPPASSTALSEPKRITPAFAQFIRSICQSPTLTRSSTSSPSKPPRISKPEQRRSKAGKLVKRSSTSSRPLYALSKAFHTGNRHESRSTDVEVAVESLLGNSWLTDTVVSDVLEPFTYFHPLIQLRSTHWLDVLLGWHGRDFVELTNREGDQPAKLVIPMHLHDHWVVALCDLQHGEMHLYDSIGGKYETEAKEKLKEFSEKLCRSYPQRWTHWSITRKDSSMQRNGYDCGVHTIVNAIYLLSDRPVPLTIDAKHWRTVFTSMLIQEDLVSAVNSTAASYLSSLSSLIHSHIRAVDLATRTHTAALQTINGRSDARNTRFTTKLRNDAAMLGVVASYTDASHRN